MPQLSETADRSPAANREHLGPLHYALFAGGILATAIMNHRLREDFSAMLGGAPLPNWRIFFGILLNAAPVAAFALTIIRWRQRSGTFPAQFGHWLLLIHGAIFLMQFLTSTPFWRELLPGMRDYDSEYREAHWRIHLFFFWLGCITVPCLAVYWSRGEDLWRFYAVALILSITCIAWLNAVSDLGGQQQAARGLNMLLNAAVMLSFAIATVRDIFWRAGENDALHWLGIATTLALMSLQRILFFVPI